MKIENTVCDLCKSDMIKLAQGLSGIFENGVLKRPEDGTPIVNNWNSAFLEAKEEFTVPCLVYKTKFAEAKICQPCIDKIRGFASAQLFYKLNTKKIEDIPEELENLIRDNTIHLMDGLEKVLPEHIKTGKSPKQITAEMGLETLMNFGDLEEICKKCSEGFTLADRKKILGLVMKKSRGQYSPALVMSRIEKVFLTH